MDTPYRFKLFKVQMREIQIKFSIRKLVIVAALLLGSLFFLTRVAEMQSIMSTIQQGDWRFILLAVGVESVWMISIAAAYRAIYRSMGLDESIPKLLLLSMASSFVNVVAPSGVGMGGMAVMISDASRKGFSSARVTVSGLLVVLLDYVSFLCVLAAGFLVLIRRDDLDSTELVASIFLLALATGLIVLVYLGMHSPDALSRVVVQVTRLVNRLMKPLLHRELLSERRAKTFAYEAVDGLRLLRARPGGLVISTALTLLSKGLLVVVLFLMFLSFKTPISFGTLLAGFSIGYLFMIVSPTPAGIGVVEGALPLALGSLHVPLGSAAVIALSYRGITFWMPLLFGMLAFRWLSVHSQPSPNSHLF